MMGQRKYTDHSLHEQLGTVFLGVLCFVLSMLGKVEGAEVAAGKINSDWKYYLKLAEEGQWDEFGKLDGEAFKAQFWPRLKETQFATNASYIFVSGSGVVNWANRQQGLTAQQKQNYFKEAYPLVKRAAELGHYGAMVELAWMLTDGMGIEKAPKEAIAWADSAWKKTAEVLGTNSLKMAVIADELNSAVYYPLQEDKRSVAILWVASAIRKKILGGSHVDYLESLNNLGLAQVRAQEYGDAEAAFKEEIAISHNPTSEAHPLYTRSLFNLAWCYDRWNKNDQAEPLYLQALGIWKQKAIEESATYLNGADTVAEFYFKIGHFGQAESIYQEALEVRKKVLGIEHTDYVATMINLGGALFSAKNFDKAYQVFQEVAEIRRKTLGEENADYASDLNTLAGVCKLMSKFSQAERFILKALEIRKKTVGEEHPEYAKTLNGLGALYIDMKEYTKAEPLLLNALEIQKKTVGEAHPDYVQVLLNCGELYKGKLEYSKAEAFFVNALEIRKKVLGEAHPDYATSLNNLATLYQEMGKFAKVELLLLKALEIRKKTVGEEHPEYVQSLNVLALLYESKGEFVKAEELFEQGIKIHKKVSGEDRNYATSLNNLANLYGKMGREAKAEPLHVKAMEIWKKTVGEEHEDYALSIANLGTFYLTLGDYAKAEPLLRQALELRKNALGKEHPDYAASLNNLGMLLRGKHEYEQALPLMKEAMEIWKKVLGEEHRDYALSLNNLAALYDSMGEYEQALPLMKEAMEIWKKVLGEEHPLYAVSLINLVGGYLNVGEYTKAEPLLRQAVEILKKALGEEHPDYATSLNALSYLLTRLGRPTEAYPMALEAVKISRRHQDLTYGVQSESGQLALQEMEIGKLSPLFNSGLVLGNKGEEVYGEWVKWKGAVTERQMWLRESLGEEGGKAWDELKAVRRQLATALLANPKGTNDVELIRKRVEGLEESKDKLERELARSSTEYAAERARARKGVKDVKEALAEGTVLLDYAGYAKRVKDAAGKWGWKPHLTVFVVRAGKPVEWVDLGPEEEIGEWVKKWRAAINPQTGSYAQEEAAGKELRKRLWEPVAQFVAKSGQVLVSPDGVMAQVPLGALPGAEAGKYLVEERSFVTVPVVQRIGEKVEEKKAGKEQLLVVGDVDYGAEPGSNAVLVASLEHRSVYKGRSGIGHFEALTNTRGEMLSVRDSYERARPDGVVKVLRAAQATEGEIVQWIERSRWVHVATHGYYDTNRVSAVGVRSGLALAGANRKEWREGEDDGILTAEEVEALDLKGTELVVLSACETGLGVGRQGEGLLGMQRAFQVAGARSVVGSLWQVDDEWTRKLMERFYEEIWVKGRSDAEALSVVQLAMMREAPKRGGSLKEPAGGSGKAREKASPYYWAAFVLSSAGGR